MTPFTAFVLIAIGVALVLADFFIPSFGVLTLAGLGLVAWSVHSLFRVSAVLGWSSLVYASVVLAAAGWLGWRLFKRSPFLHSARVENEPLPPGEDAVAPGDCGVAVTPLRPSGKARVRGRLYDAICESGMLDAGARVCVTSVRRGELGVREAADE